jgi:hypothetical protein
MDKTAEKAAEKERAQRVVGSEGGSGVVMQRMDP